MKFIHAVLLCGLLTVLMFGSVLVLHSWAPIGVDGYAYYSSQTIPHSDRPGKAIFDLIGYSEMTHFLLLGIFFFLFLLGTWTLAKKLEVKNDWLAILLVLSTPLAFIRFSELEYMQFVYVLIPWIWLLYIKITEEKAGSAFKFSIITMIIAAWILVFINNLPSLTFFFPVNKVGETAFLSSASYLFILLLGFFGLRKYKQLAIPAIIIFFLSIFNPLLAIILVPLLAVGLTRLGENNIIPNPNIDLRWFFTVLAIIGIFNTMFYIIPEVVPTQDQWNMVVSTSYNVAALGGSFNVDWEYVHWFNYLHEKTSFLPSVPGDGGCCPITSKAETVLTRQKQFNSNQCLLIISYSDGNLFRCK